MARQLIFSDRLYSDILVSLSPSRSFESVPTKTTARRKFGVTVRVDRSRWEGIIFDDQRPPSSGLQQYNTTIETTTMCRTTVDEIIIRAFRPEDLPQVKELFTSGMMGLIPEFFKVGMLRWNVSRAFWLLLAASSPVVPGMYQGVAGLGWMAWHCRYISKAMKGYTKHGRDSDLADIQGVYLKNGGNFLVAATPDGKVVGMVAGEPKEDNSIELRRMSVDQTIQKKGVASRLIQRLQEDAKKAGFVNMFLTCSSVQYAAQGLYRKNLFDLVKTVPMMVGVNVHKFEKKL
jgi:predicted GNAT family acetyltransferase